MTNKINKITTLFAVFLMVLLIIATRGHSNWISSFVHLPDFTIPALFIAGVYLRKFWVVFVLILSAVSVDNYAIVHQGVSANCITPAYSLLPLTFYGIFWSGKYISSLAINKDIIKNSLIIISVVSIQWLMATASYYFFTATFIKTGWSNFPAYMTHWSLVEIPTTLYWMMAVIIVFTLVPRIVPALNFQRSAG
ncbi:MAG: hypothetical protein DSY43_01975 [Gammaproteobacteria bacterium]|uniref:Uncharacterized protein n=1 Tax=endosymbiont of Bathymodiolus septemdierum str. Myojin knoll TaxID=1303921 RepID=A0A0P0URA4_9GAMM|nr:hypothetical protein [Bathymodiolus septemdierum thioautotrophic gill symbiont]RUA06421.1 MAG: hypothetical protein DSY43_01975 [Gammaproteobacteria bacterium]BAS67758.1 conserved hypothetical protein [endosymbiont of Bathymodiolus septemdierum str. Myojin knoll]